MIPTIFHDMVLKDRGYGFIINRSKYNLRLKGAQKLRSLGIKYQLRLTTLIPLIVVALLFSFFYNRQFNLTLDQHTSRLGEAYIRQLLPAAQLALLRDDRHILQGLVDASTINQEVQSLAFYNKKGQLLAYRGGKHSLKKPFRPPDFTGDYIESQWVSPFSINFVAPITLPKFNLYSFVPYAIPANPKTSQAGEILGWLSIDIDTQAMLIKRYQMYIVTIFITLIGLLIGLSIHYLLSKRIYIPIARLRRSMKQILSNEFETEIKTTSPGELGTIEKGCARLQEEYFKLTHEMNQYIETATEDLQRNLEVLEEKNIELSLDKKKTEEKSRQKSEFIANMSHEIRTPMNGVIGFTNVLLESQLNPLQEDYVKTIKSSAQDLLAIINDILDYSKIDAGKLRLDNIPLDIRACVDDVLALLAPNAHKKGLDLIPSTDISVPRNVIGDPLRLKQIMNNLIANAIKFTDQGYVLIRVKIEAETALDYTLSVAVTDTGIGISETDQNNLFNSFHQGDTTIARRYGGSGLGLVITKKLAEHMSGKITLESKPHQGSTFKVQIKVSKLTAYEIEKHQTHRFSTLKVLCFDDNPLYLEALCNGLGVWGIETIKVNAFNELQSALRKHQDCHMAFINVNKGCEKQVSRVIRSQNMPCVLVSKWLISNYESLGAKGFLFKPPNIQKLHDTIDSVLNQIGQEAYDLESPITDLKHLRAEVKNAQLNLLVAEDNPVNQRLLKSFLGQWTNLLAVHDGVDAVKKCEIERFDCILLDLQMPHLNGLDAAKQIRRASSLNKKTPIILISANNIQQNQNTLYKSGIDVCLQKPFDEQALLEHLLETTQKIATPAIDWQLCLQRVSNNHKLAADFLTRFVEELQKERQQFISLFNDGRFKELEQAAHKLYGACCFCGVPALQKLTANLETLATNAKSKTEIKAIFEVFISAIDDVIKDYHQNHDIQTQQSETFN